MADSAWHYNTAALRCAEQADDWELRARALGDLSQAAAESGRGDDALTFAEQAAVRADRLYALRRAKVALHQARAHGLLGNRQACLTAIGRAEDKFAAADPADRHNWVLKLDTAELHGDSGCTLYALALRGESVDATVDRLREAIASYPATFPRSRALAGAKLATLLMHAGDPAEATKLGHQVLDAADTMQSARVANSIRDLHHAATRHRGTPDVDALHERTTRVLAAS